MPARGDPGRVGEPGGDDAEGEDGHPPGDDRVGVDRRRRGGAHRQHADGAEQRQLQRAEGEADARQRDRRQAGTRRRREDEVGGAPDHRRQRPQHAAEREVGARQQIEHEHEPDGGDRGAGDRQPPRTLAAAQPQPHDDRGRRGVLDQQRRTDVHPLHGGEVRELRAGDGTRAEQHEQAGVGAQRAPAAAQRAQREREHDQRRDRQPREHHGTWRPAVVEQPARERAGHAEGARRDHGKDQSGSYVIAHRPHHQ